MIIQIKGRKVAFSLEMYGKYNIITGNSGTRKTDFLNSLDKFKKGLRGFFVYIETDSGLQLTKEDLILLKNETVICGDYHEIFIHNQDKLIVIDESSEILRKPDIAEVFKDSKNYFIIITRKLFGRLPLGADSIYRLENNDGTIVNRAVYCNDNNDLTTIGNISLLNKYI
jgi:hypothetical protein